MLNQRATTPTRSLDKPRTNQRENNTGGQPNAEQLKTVLGH